MRAGLRAIESRALFVAPWLLLVSLIADILITADPVRSTAIDFHVYRDAAPNLFGGHLYDYRLGSPKDSFPLPFLYPPFAALPILPLSELPWGLALWLWHAISVACVWWLVRSSFRIISGYRGETWDGTWNRRTMLATALLLWVEPVRLTLAYGQVNLVLAAILLAGLLAASELAAGAAVGVTAGTKLTPAIAGLYLLAVRRFAAAAWSIVIFLATVGIGFLTGPGQAMAYWFGQAHDAGQRVPMGTVLNQSLRGALGRSLGHDPAFSLPWLLLAAVAVVLAGLALRAALRAGDRLPAIVAVQFLGLLLSPISWNHHWVWMVPALLWLLYGRHEAGALGRRLRRASAAVWLLVVGCWVVMGWLLPGQGDIWSFHHHGYITALAWAYPVAGVLTMITMVVTCRPVSRPEPEPETAKAALAA